MKIKALIMDVDGTLTDGKIYIGNTGESIKAFNVKDGYGISQILPKYGILSAIITGRTSLIVKNRVDELKVDYLYQGITNKTIAIQEFEKESKIGLQQIAYIGDDLNDLEVMKMCGIKACPSDAVKEIKEISDYVCAAKGGEGAVREFIEYLVRCEE